MKTKKTLESDSMSQQPILPPGTNFAIRLNVSTKKMHHTELTTKLREKSTHAFPNIIIRYAFIWFLRRFPSRAYSKAPLLLTVSCSCSSSNSTTRRACTFVSLPAHAYDMTHGKTTRAAGAASSSQTACTAAQQQQYTVYALATLRYYTPC